MLNATKELTPVVYGEKAIKLLKADIGPQTTCFVLHWHERMELLRVTAGSLELRLGEHPVILRAGQIGVISPKQPHHGIAGAEGVKYDCLMFDPRKFYNPSLCGQDRLEAIFDQRVTFTPCVDSPRVLDTADRLIRSVEEEQEHPLSTVGLVYELIGTLYREGQPTEQKIYQNSGKFAAVLEYIQQHYCEGLTTAQLSRRFCYDEAYFCRRFKAVTGLTFTTYVRILRLERACNLLRDTDRDVQNIAIDCGFADAAGLIRAFGRHYGLAPGDWRRRSRG